MRVHVLGAFLFLFCLVLSAGDGMAEELPCTKGRLGERVKCLSEELASLKRTPGPQGEKGEKGEKRRERPELKVTRAIPERKVRRARKGTKATQEKKGIGERKAKRGIKAIQERHQTHQM